MRAAALLLLGFLGLSNVLQAQPNLDISNLKADPKTFIFNDGKRTVNGYIYGMLESKTSCCGNDAVYLEVKYNAEGVVTAAKPLTGKNDCYKQSVCEIVKTVVWDATASKGAGTVYFEVKPVVPCSGSPGENQYKPIFSGAAVVATQPAKQPDVFGDENKSDAKSTEETVAEVKEEIKEAEKEEEEVVAEVVKAVTPKEEVKEEDDGFLSEEVGMKEESAPPAKTTTTVEKSTPPAKSTASASKPKSGGGVQLPPQAEEKYVSVGDRRPEESHSGSHWNGTPTGGATNAPKYATGESQVAISLKSELRKNGHCGIAQAVIEVTLDPQGNVVTTNVMASSSPKINELVPGVVKNIKFEPRPGMRFNYSAYIEFKADVVCDPNKKGADLNSVPDILNTASN